MFVEQRQREWADLQGRGLFLLENSDQLTPREQVREMNPVLRLWLYPSGEAYLSWTVFKSRQNAEHDLTLVRRTIWDRIGDARRLRESGNPNTPVALEPTIQVKDVILSSQDINRLNLDRKFALGVAVSREVVGLDETTSGLQTFSFLGGLRVTWWQGGPPEWREMITWATEIRLYLLERMAD